MCTKEEIDSQIQKIFSDSERNEPLPPIQGLKHPTGPGVKFYLGDFREKEVDMITKKARTKSAPGGDGIS